MQKFYFDFVPFYVYRKEVLKRNISIQYEFKLSIGFKLDLIVIIVSCISSHDLVPWVYPALFGLYHPFDVGSLTQTSRTV